MVVRAFIKLITPEVDIASGDKPEPYLDCAWDGRHPGDEIESKVLIYINEAREKDLTQSYSRLINQDGVLLFLRWDADFAAGICLILSLFGEEGIDIPLSRWAQHLYFYSTLKSDNTNEFFNDYVNPSFEDVERSSDKLINPGWLKASLEAGTVELSVKSENDFVENLCQFIELFPWTPFLIDQGTFKDELLTIEFIGGGITDPIDYEELFLSLAGDPIEGFWNLIYRAVTNLINVKHEDRYTAIRTSLILITSLTREDNDPFESLKLIYKYIDKLLILDADMTIRFANIALSNSALIAPSYHLSKILLQVAEKVYKSDFIDLAKLAEGTALQIAFALDDPSHREEIFLEVTERSKTWGNDHLVGYIQSVTGILSDNRENQEILAKIVQSSEKILKESWDGLLCLVETSIVAGEVLHAVELRFEAITRLTEKEMRADDTFEAINWALDLEELDEKEFTALLIPVLAEAIDNLPIGEIFLNHMEGFVNRCLEREKLYVLADFLNWLTRSIIHLSIKDRIPLLSMLETFLATNIKYLQLLIQTQLIKFNILISERDVDNYEQTSNLLRSIYNNVDPTKSYGRELITLITRSIIFSSSNSNFWEFINEARKRFTLLLNDESVSQPILVRLFSEAGKNRIDSSTTRLKKNDIGVTLYSEALTMANLETDGEVILGFMEQAKKISLRTGSFDAFAKFVEAEMTLNRTQDLPWTQNLIDSVKALLEKGALSEANNLFSKVFSFELSLEEEFDFITTELELVEYEPDFISAEQIFSKRNRLLELSTSREGEEVNAVEIIKNFRDGISELISKGNDELLSDFLLKAIVFSHENAPESIEEFSTILVDSFSSNLETFKNTMNNKIYFELISTFRKINSTFQSTNLDLPMKLANMLISTNLRQMVTSKKPTLFLRRGQLVAKEISFILKVGKEADIPYSYVEKITLLSSIDILMDAIITQDYNFGLVDGLMIGSVIYHNLDEKELLFILIDKVLTEAKRSAVKAKDVTSMVMISIFILSEIFIITDAEFVDEYLKLLRDRLLKLLDVVLSVGKSSDLIDQIKVFRNQVLDVPRQAFQEFPFTLDGYLVNLSYQS